MSDQVLRPSLKTDLQKMDSFEFEHFVADLWERRGWQTFVSQESSDRGVDITAVRSDDGFQTKAVIQAKRFQSDNRVGSPQIQQYASLREQEDADLGVVVTTSSFTDQAESLADDLNLKLVDINDLASVIEEQQSDNLLEEYDLVEEDADGPDGEDHREEDDPVEQDQDDEEHDKTTNTTEGDSSGRSRGEPIVNPRPAEIGLTSDEAWGFWGKGVAVSTFLLFSASISLIWLITPGSTASIVGGLIYILSAIWLIISIYKDATNLHDSSLEWKPTRTVYIIAVVGLARILLGFLVGVIYLLIRRLKVTYPRPFQ